MMLASLKYRLAFLAMTKAGSTAIEAALEPHCEVVFRRDPQLKHMQYQRFDRFVRPMLERDRGRVETVCLFREPIDWLGSWYRYRQRASLQGSANSTHELSFDAFVDGYLSPDQPPWARVGKPARFVRASDGSVGVDHIFRYEALDACAAFIGARIGARLVIGTENVSPRRTLTLEPARRAALEAHFAEDFALYEAARSQA